MPSRRAGPERGPDHSGQWVDELIIGGGVAGVTLAAHLAERSPDRDIVLVEAEPTLAFHTSGRSAHQLVPSYGPDAVQELTRWRWRS